MNILVIIAVILFGAPKQNIYKVRASGNEYFISIRSGVKAISYSPFKGKFKEIIKGDKIDVRIFATKLGDNLTIEIFKNGKLCASKYNWCPLTHTTLIDLECN